MCRHTSTSTKLAGFADIPVADLELIGWRGPAGPAPKPAAELAGLVPQDCADTGCSHCRDTVTLTAGCVRSAHTRNKLFSKNKSHFASCQLQEGLVPGK